MRKSYGVEVPNIAYHLRKIFQDSELDRDSVIKEILITGPDGKNYMVKHNNLQVAHQVEGKSVFNRKRLLKLLSQKLRRISHAENNNRSGFGQRQGKAGLRQYPYSWHEISVYREMDGCCEAPGSACIAPDVNPDDLDASDSVTFTWELA